MKKIITLLIILIAFCELKAQNKQLEFNVEKPDVGVDIIIDKNLVVGWEFELKLITKYKNKKYRFTFTHGTIEQKEQVLLVHPDKTGEGTIKVYELIEKKYKLVKEVVVDVFERPMNYFGDVKVNYIDQINDTSTLNQPFTIKLNNESKELIFIVQGFKLSWVCNDTIYEQKITGNIIDTTTLSSIYKNCNPVKLYIESIIYKDEKGNTKRSAPLILDYSVPK